MAVSASLDHRHHGLLPLDLGVEPPIETVVKRHITHDRRHLSLRWLTAVVLTGVAGSGLILTTIYAALDGKSNLAQAPELAVPARREKSAADGPERGDPLIRAADIVAEKQRFRAPTTVRVGDKQIIRMRAFTRVTTTLTLAPTEAADDVPEFNSLKLLSGGGGSNQADPPADPGLALDDADVSFTTRDLSGLDGADFGGSLSPEEIEAQVSEFGRNSFSTGRLALPAQLLLMRTSRAGQLPIASLAFAGAGFRPAPFSSIEVRMVPENVTIKARTDMPRDGANSEERLVVFRHGDILEDVLRNNGATREQVRSIINAFGARRGEAPVSDGRRLKLLFTRLDDDKPRQIARISVYDDETLETTIALSDNGDYVRVAGLDNAPRHKAPASGDDDPQGGLRIYDSFYQTALKQEIPKPIIDGMVHIFANEIDFQRAVAGGDSFDAFYADPDDAEGHAELLYASITVRNEVYKYYRFQTPDDAGVDYFDENGRSVRKFLMRNPVPNSVMTSGFGLRFHPILGYSRPHTGVDWAAPIGTPVLASGAGTILRAHPESGYGNRIEIQHANGYITTYSHLAGFARGITDGVRVRQGQVVGYLGQTGLATGPHLHYEVIVNGSFVDPMVIKLGRTTEMEGKQLVDFKRERDRIDGLMASAPNAVDPGADKHAAN